MAKGNFERITHSESPWKAARAGYSDGIPSHEPIPDENIKSYFQAMNEKYDFSSESELSIISMIFCNNFTAPLSFIKGLVNPTLIRRKPKTASPKMGLPFFMA